MFCSQCGSRIDDSSRFCPECGAKIRTPETAAPAPDIPVGNMTGYSTEQCQRVTQNVFLCPDGTYRWVYEYNMLRDPTIFFTVCKVIGISFGSIYLFSLLIMLVNEDISMEGFIDTSRVFLILTVVFIFIGFISYLIVAALNGGKYTVLFEMNEHSITHKQLDSSVKKVEALRLAGLIVGAVSGSFTTTGSALLVKSSLTTDLSKVKNIKVKRSRHLIKVNETLNKNQVYIEADDFDFVLNYINTHIPADAKRK